VRPSTDGATKGRQGLAQVGEDVRVGIWFDWTRNLAGETDISVGWHSRPGFFGRYGGREMVGNVLINHEQFSPQSGEKP
jgi:hypothetical protein